MPMDTAHNTVLVAITDIFFYTKVRDALLPQGYRLEKARGQQDIADKAAATHPIDHVVRLVAGDDALRLHHHGESFDVTADKPVTLPIPRLHATPRPAQPAGRAPQRRHPHAKTK